MSKNLTVEVALFKTKPGVSDAAVIRASETIMPWLSAQPGYVRRELLKGEDGQWMDLVHWRSRKEALDAMAASQTEPSVASLGAVIDFERTTMLHLDQVQTHNL